MELPEITQKWVAYTPEKAQKVLETNIRNRNVRRYLVEAYARDMLAGRWKPTGEAIKISNTGVLLDGQHRLRAVVLAGEQGMTKPVAILTVMGLPDETQMVMDTGAARSASDALQLDGFRSSATIAAAAKTVMNIERGTLFEHASGANKVTNSEVLEWLNKYPEFPTFVEDYQWRARKTKINPSGILSAHWMLWSADQDSAEEFFTKLSTLEGLSAGSPVLALNRLVTDLKARRTRLSIDQWIGMYFHAYNRWKAGARVQYQRLPPGGYTRSNFPWPQGLKPEVYKGKEASDAK